MRLHAARSLALLSRAAPFSKFSSKFAAKCQLGVYLSNDVVICVAMQVVAAGDGGAITTSKSHSGARDRHYASAIH
jgi:hypothetical protein